MIRRVFFAITLLALLSLRAAGPGGARMIRGSYDWQASTALPGAPLTFNVQTHDAKDFSVDIFPVDADSYEALTQLGGGDPGEFSVNAVRHVSAVVTNPSYWSSTPVTVPGLPIGLYAVRVSAANFVGVRQLDVGTLGVISAQGKSDRVSFAVDLNSYHKRTDVRFETLDDKPQRAQADESGTASFAIDGDTTVKATAADGSIAYAYHGNYDDRSYARTFLQTDRPLYRPADTVHFRILSRSGMPGAYTLPTGDATVEIRDPSYKLVLSTNAAFDSYGTLTGDFVTTADAELGRYNVTVNGQNAGEFTVEAYVKPEYDVSVSPKADHVIAGNTARFTVSSRYFFGKPAAGIHFSYRAMTTPPPPWWYGGYLRFFGYHYHDQEAQKPDVTGEATADSRGLATISIPTSVLSDTDQEIRMDVDARDASGKTVTARGIVPITRADIRTRVSFDRWFANRSEDVGITIDAATIAGVPQGGVPVAIAIDMYNHSDTDAPAEKLSAVTDQRGSARVRWRADRSGYLRVTATARDPHGRETTSTSYLWVESANDRTPYVFTQAAVTSEKTAYAPGENADLLIVSPRADVDALVNVTGNAGDDRTFVAHLATSADVVRVAVPRGVARSIVTIWIPTPQGITTAQTTLTVTPATHALSMHVRGDRKTYRPGELATFAVDVRDAEGAPARAQVGIGVVDDSVLALADPSHADYFDRLYAQDLQTRGGSANWSLGDIGIGASDRRVMTIAHITARAALAPGQTKDVYSVNAQMAPMPAPTPANAPSFANLRSDFRDTAYWSPTITTDERGHAIVKFRWPDNLTSYTANALAITQDTSVGSGDGHALVTKPYLVRLATPRFLRTNDVARFVANANGPKGAADTLMRFSAPALGIGDATVRAKFDRNADATSDFNVASTTLGTSLLRLAGTAGPLSDGLQRPLTVESDLVAAHVRFAGALPNDPSVSLSLPAGTVPGGLHVDLSPSVLAQLLASVRLLDVYPYGCVEQTMSAALPLIAVERLAKRSGLKPTANPDPDAIAEHAVARLKKLQHGDGSWGWWENDAANPFMTGYALYGLAELKRDGHDVPDDMIARGVASLKAQLGDARDTAGLDRAAVAGSLWNTRAFMLFALSDVAPAEMDRTVLAAADAHAGDLNPYALSVLGLAHVGIGDRTGAQPLFERLQTLSIDRADFTHWSGGGWHYGWEDDPIETTAYALRFYHAMEPDASRVRRAVAWLRAQSHGSWWYTTKDTAAAIYALTEAIDPDRSEFSPNETVDVFANDKLLRTVHITSLAPDASNSSLDVAAADVPAGGALRFVRHGTGSLYWSVDWTHYLRDGALSTSDIPADDAAALQADTSDDFTVTRTYSSPGNGPWRIGDQLDVTLTVTAKSDAQFVAIEDPLPAGLEFQPRLHEAGDDWSGLQFFDDRVVFFTTYLSKKYPLELKYRLRASTVGTFTAPPPTAYAMYGPPVSAIGRAQRVKILP